MGARCAGDVATAAGPHDRASPRLPEGPVHGQEAALWRPGRGRGKGGSFLRLLGNRLRARTAR